MNMSRRDDNDIATHCRPAFLIPTTSALPFSLLFLLDLQQSPPDWFWYLLKAKVELFCSLCYTFNKLVWTSLIFCLQILENNLDFWGLQINQSIQFWSGFIPINGDGRIYPTLTAISPTPTLNLARFMASFFSKPTLLLSFYLCLPRLLWSFSLPLALHFKLQHFSQNMSITPPQHMPVPSHSIRLCHLSHCSLQSQHLH